LQAGFAGRPEPYAEFRKHLVLLERSPDDLRERVAARARAMLEAGLVDEVRALREAGIERNPAAASAIGYRETLAHLRGDVDGTELGAAIVRNTLRLAKKQRTWFRTQLREPDERVRRVAGNR
jgi:tRNA dimethylallyltransferase